MFTYASLKIRIAVRCKQENNLISFMSCRLKWVIPKQQNMICRSENTSAQAMHAEKEDKVYCLWFQYSIMPGIQILSAILTN